MVTLESAVLHQSTVSGDEDFRLTELKPAQLDTLADAGHSLVNVRLTTTTLLHQGG